MMGVLNVYDICIALPQCIYVGARICILQYICIHVAMLFSYIRVECDLLHVFRAFINPARPSTAPGVAGAGADTCTDTKRGEHWRAAPRRRCAHASFRPLKPPTPPNTRPNHSPNDSLSLSLQQDLPTRPPPDVTCSPHTHRGAASLPGFYYYYH